MRTRILSVSIAIALFGNAMSPQATVCVAQEKQSGPRRTPAQMLERIMSNDKNSDGKITRDEATEQLKRFFDRLDTNGDDAIDRDELKSMGDQLARQRRNSNRRAPQQNRTPPTATIPEGVELITDIRYRDGNDKWKVDLAMPKDPDSQPRPALVFVHGGGWRSGDKSGGQWRNLPLEYASKGYVCISVNYRLTDEAVFPACVEDVKCAVRWLRSNAKKYNVDPKRLGAYGNSAGAHLVSMLGLVGPAAKLEGDGPYQDQSSLVQAVCCSATPTDFSNWGARGGSTRAKSSRGPSLLSGPAETLDERRKKASPISYVSPNAPPFLIIHGTADTTVPFSQGENFATALKAAGAQDVTFLKYEGAGHGVFGQQRNETYPAMEKFFARTLRSDDK